MVKLSLWGAPKIKANLGITLLPGLHCCWILHWDVTDCAGMMSDTGMDALLGFQLVLLGGCQAIFPHSRLPDVHPCFSVASAGTWLRALVWNMWCTPRLSGPGIPNVLQRAAAQDLVPNLSSGKWLGVLFFLPEHGSLCLTADIWHFCCHPTDLSLSSTLTTVSYKLSLWLLKSLLCMIHPHFSSWH